MFFYLTILTFVHHFFEFVRPEMRSATPKVQTTVAQMTKDTSATSKKAAAEDRTLNLKSSGPQEKLLDDDYCESNVDSGFLSGSLSLTSSEFDVKTEKSGDLTSCFSKSQQQAHKEVVCRKVLEAFEPDQDGDT